MKQKNHIFLYWLALLTFVSIGGCADETPITTQTIPKDRSGLSSLRAPTPVASKSQTNRMVVALFQEPSATWFFKINGPEKDVASSESEWMAFFDKIRFTEGIPTWDLPAGWEVGPSKPMRFKTLMIGSVKPALEVSISSLGPNQDLLSNANRWLGQLSLPNAAEGDLDSLYTEHQTDQTKYLVFDKTGKGSGQMTPPFASGMPMGDTADSAEGPLEYDTPEGWSKGRTSGMVPVRLEKSDGDQKVQITAIEMPADANEWKPNVERWAGQVGLSDLSQDELDKRTETVAIDGVEGKLITLIGTDTESPNGTLAVLAKRGGSAWFFKIFGDKKMVEGEQETFKKFLNSVQFK